MLYMIKLGMDGYNRLNPIRGGGDSTTVSEFAKLSLIPLDKCVQRLSDFSRVLKLKTNPLGSEFLIYV